MNEPFDIERVEFEELLARLLDVGLDETSHLRLDSLLDTHPEWENDLNDILNVNKLIRSVEFEKQEIDLLKPKTDSLIVPISFHFTMTMKLSFAAIFLAGFIPLFIFIFNIPSVTAINPVASSFTTRGNCFNNTGLLKEGMPLPDRIAATSGSLCQFHFDYEKSVDVTLKGPGSLRIETTPSAVLVKLQSGKLLLSSRDNKKGGHLLVEADNHLFEARGTVFYIEKHTDSPLLLAVKEGSVSISLKIGDPNNPQSMDSILLHAGRAWVAGSDSEIMAGKQSVLTKDQDAMFFARGSDHNKQKDQGPAFLQRLTTKTGQTYTGIVQQTTNHYNILTSDGTVQIPIKYVEKIEMFFSQEN